MDITNATGLRTGSHPTIAQSGDRSPGIDPGQARREAWRRAAAGFATASKVDGLDAGEVARMIRCQRFCQRAGREVVA